MGGGVRSGLMVFGLDMLSVIHITVDGSSHRLLVVKIFQADLEMLTARRLAFPFGVHRCSWLKLNSDRIVGDPPMTSKLGE
jgi:hypothetical protein